VVKTAFRYLSRQVARKSWMPFLRSRWSHSEAGGQYLSINKSQAKKNG